MILSSIDIYRILTGNVLLASLARVRIVDDRPPLTPEDGVVIYVSRYPELSEIEASWRLWIVDYDSEPLDLVITQLRQLLGSFQVVQQGQITQALVTDLRSGRTDIAPPAAPVPAGVDTESIEQLKRELEDLKDSIEDRLLLLRNGHDGKDGRDGQDGRDGRDVDGTSLKLGEISDVDVVDAQSGQALIYEDKKWVAKYQELRASEDKPLTQHERHILDGIIEGGEPMGHANRAESVISFDDASRTFTITPIVDRFRIWVRGKRFRINKPRSIQIPDETGLYFIFFKKDGQLDYRLNYFTWNEEAPTAYIYWDAVNKVCPYFAEERHGIVLDWQTHEYLHRTRGAAIASGFDILNYALSGTGNLDSDAQFDIGNGTFFDEDIKIEIMHNETPPAEGFEQHLRGPARLPVVYRDGDVYLINEATDFPLKMGAIHPYYNSFIGSEWTLVEAQTNKYINQYVVATNNLRAPVVSLMGQHEYANQGDAKAESFSSLNITGFPSKEFRFLYKVTYRVGNYTNQVKSIISAIQDLRYYTALPSALLS